MRERVGFIGLGVMARVHLGDMIRRSDPVPRPPAVLTDDTFSYNLPVDFKGRK